MILLVVEVKIQKQNASFLRKVLKKKKPTAKNPISVAKKVAWF